MNWMGRKVAREVKDLSVMRRAGEKTVVGSLRHNFAFGNTIENFKNPKESLITS